MSLKKFRDDLLNQLLTFLWGEWDSLGLAGSPDKNNNLPVDPEALLVFSLQLARFEPRLFDEILGWMIENGHWLDAARLRRILQGHDPETARLVGAALRFCVSHSAERKWENLADYCESVFKKQPKAATASLFKEKSGKNYPLGAQKNSDKDFMRFRLDHPTIKNLRATRPVPVNAEKNVRFLLRSLLGVGGRSECLLYLLTHEGGRVRDIAEGAGLFWLSVQQLLDDLIVSGLVSTRHKGKRVEYWLSHERWWNFLNHGETTKGSAPRWAHWILIYHAMLEAWRTIESLAQNPSSDYMASSKLRDCAEHLSREFARAGLDVPPLPSDKSTKIHIKTLSRLFEKVIGKCQ